MTIPDGYAKNVAIIDLGKQEAQIIPVDRFWRDYDIDPKLWMGGDGFIAKILWKDIPAPIDPLGPENEIIISTGPWTATSAPWAGRAMLGHIDPETGGFSSGSFGWHYATALKYAGYNVVIIRGKSEKPVYVFIDNDEITFRDAAHIWGKETGDTVKTIRTELGERFEGEIRVLNISIAGENLVKYSPACADGTSCPGRSGNGAIMGSKNLKAIAVRGTGELSLYDPRGLLDTSYYISNTLLQEEPLLRLWEDHGATTSLFTAYNMPLSGKHLVENRKAADFPHFKNVGCLNCPSPCYHWIQVKEGKYSGVRQLGGHMTFVTNCLRNMDIQDFGAWIYYERLMQELGMDPASFSLSFTWAVECFERGILNIQDTDGLTLQLGDPELVWEVARKVAARDGKLGDLLADGVAAASKKIGKGSEDISPHVKGKEYLQIDPKVQAMIWSLSILTNPRGGDWNRCHNVWELAFIPERRDTYPELTGQSCAEMYEKALSKLDMPDDMKKKIFGDPPKVDADWVRSTNGKALFTTYSENSMATINSLVTCMYSGGTHIFLIGTGPTTWAKVVHDITGWNLSSEEILSVGERVFNLQRLYNYRLQGWDSRNDVWADKRVYETAEMGAYRGKPIPWNETLQEYYSVRGWSKEGIPTKSKIQELRIYDEAKDLELPD